MKEPKSRFVIPEARSFLEEKLGLVSDPYMQDWEVELADENKTDSGI